MSYVLPPFVDNVMSAHNRRCKGDANGAHAQSDSRGGRTKSDV